MKVLTQKRAVIGEGPVWNEIEQKLYFVNGIECEILIYDFNSDALTVKKTPCPVSALAFDDKNRLIVSTPNGVFILNEDNSLTEIYDTKKYLIKNCNDLKVAPNGDIFVGTMATNRKAQNRSELDGKLYRVSRNGVVSVLLKNLSLSNGLDWTEDGTKFYHTDSDASIIKEYNYDGISGDITPTDRQVKVNGVDGFTISKNGNIYASCWAYGHVAVVDCKSMEIIKYIELPTEIPTSCAFCGKNLDVLAVTTASYNLDVKNDINAGFTFLLKSKEKGKIFHRFNGLL